MKLLFPLVLITLLLSTTNCAKIKARKLADNTEKLNTYETIKAHTLLVRLQTSEQKIKRLKEKGEDAKALAEQQKTNKLNKLIMSAFKQHFQYAEVAFFYSSDGTAVRKGDFDQVRFFDADKKPVLKINIDPEAYYIAEFSRLYSDITVKKNEDGSRTMVAGSNAYPAAVIMDKDFVPVQALKTKGIFAFKTPHKAIRAMNIYLQQGLTQVQIKNQKLKTKAKMAELRSKSSL